MYQHGIKRKNKGIKDVTSLANSVTLETELIENTKCMQKILKLRMMANTDQEQAN